MKACARIRKELIDYLEGNLNKKEERVVIEHLAACPKCAAELQELKNLYGVLKEDEVILPEKEFFDNLLKELRQKEIVFAPKKRTVLFDIFKIVASAIAVLLIIIILNRNDETVELSIPFRVLLEDQEIADLSLAGVVDEQFIKEMSVVESYVSAPLDEAVEELSEFEKTEFVENLYKKYLQGT